MKDLILVLMFIILCTYTSAENPLRPIAKLPNNKNVFVHHFHKKPNNGPVKNQPMFWLSNSCHRLVTLFHTKSKVMHKLNVTIEDVERDKTMSKELKQFQIHTFRIFQKELNDSEGSIFSAIESLKRALQGDYKDILNMKESSWLRLEALKEATVREEQEYNDLLAAEKQQEEFKQHLVNSSHNRLEKILDEILIEVALAADKLESGILEHAFDQSRNVAGSHIEAVIRLDEHSLVKRSNKSTNHEDFQMSILVDTNNNQYVLMKPKDTTVPMEDHHFLQDIMLVILLAVVIGWLCMIIGLPAMFGYILAGVLVGSDGFNLIKAVVQLETLGEFGAFFILFSVGLEFSPEKIRKVWRVAVVGSVSMSVIMIVFFVIIGALLHIIPKHSAFVAACLSLSSTPLVVKFLSSASHKKQVDEDGDEYSSIMIGILVMQDVQLGVIMAILPSLAEAETDPTSHIKTSSLLGTILYTFQIIVTLLSALGVAFLVSFVLSKSILPKVFSYIKSMGSKEILLLASISVAFLMLMVTNSLGISMELGCFLAGVILSVVGHGTLEEIRVMVEPIKDFFACLFFVSIGLHIFPTFVAYEWTILVSLTLSVVLVKFVTAVFVLGVVLPLGSHSIKYVVAAGLAQVSEFSFVLGSRARRLGLLSREVYLLILSITTLSLLLAPVLWRGSIWHRHRHSHRPPLPPR